MFKKNLVFERPAYLFNSCLYYNLCHRKKYVWNEFFFPHFLSLSKEKLLHHLFFNKLVCVFLENVFFSKSLELAANTKEIFDLRVNLDKVLLKL